MGGDDGDEQDVRGDREEDDSARAIPNSAASAWLESAQQMVQS